VISPPVEHLLPVRVGKGGEASHEIVHVGGVCVRHERGNLLAKAGRVRLGQEIDFQPAG
jgi:hypothetical protein